MEKNLIPGQRVLIETHISATGKIQWMPGTFVEYRSAIDRDFRLHVRYDNGWEVTDAAPECVRHA